MLVTERMQALGDHAKSSQQPPLRERRAASKDAGMPKQVAIDESVSEVVAAQLPIARKDDESATKRAIIHEWENWSALHSDELDDPGAGKYFFRHLQEKRLPLLNFPSDDKWQSVRAWLVGNGSVKD
jgi:hypothetical protein